MAHKQQKFIAHCKAKKSEIRRPAEGLREGLFQVAEFLLHPHMAEEGEGPLFNKHSIPINDGFAIYNLTTSQGLIPNTMNLAGRIQPMNFERTHSDHSNY